MMVQKVWEARAHHEGEISRQLPFGVLRVALVYMGEWLAFRLLELHMRARTNWMPG
jgi:hypothetical protein